MHGCVGPAAAGKSQSIIGLRVQRESAGDAGSDRDSSTGLQEPAKTPSSLQGTPAAAREYRKQMAVLFEATNIHFCVCCIFLFLSPLKFPTPVVASGGTTHWETLEKCHAGACASAEDGGCFVFSFPQAYSIVWQRDVRIRSSGIGECARIY